MLNNTDVSTDHIDDLRILGLIAGRLARSAITPDLASDWLAVQTLARDQLYGGDGHELVRLRIVRGLGDG